MNITHRTISLADEVWAALADELVRRGMTTDQLIVEAIHKSRHQPPRQNPYLSSPYPVIGHSLLHGGNYLKDDV